ncbi:hypothetical protein PoB_004485700 [Plakobranchus ocellatus]|uniref:Uncharacterized protein n=1 Tax=Plakobranchus ocellatus TaxID=259542 RepID=A0AAV4BG34_9GAST|nr:hypothetical protein PoB_004485700 [Plakobranchus ocellatus]
MNGLQEEKRHKNLSLYPETDEFTQQQLTGSKQFYSLFVMCFGLNRAPMETLVRHVALPPGMRNQTLDKGYAHQGQSHVVLRSVDTRTKTP